MDVFKEIFLMEQTYATLFSLANKIQVKGDQYYEKITSRQLMTMIAIAHLPENQTTINNVARKLGTTKQSTKQMMNVLEKKEYINTVPSELDKRAVNIRITELGKEVMMEYGEVGIRFFTDLFREFTTEEMETLWTLLKKLYRFDGEEQDGFEENVQIDTDEKVEKTQERIIEEFKMRRYGINKKGESGNE